MYIYIYIHVTSTCIHIPLCIVYMCLHALSLLPQLLQIPEDKLKVGLTHRSIETQRDKVLSPLTVEQARYARDAFSKAVYERMFTWLVERLNSSLENKVHTHIILHCTLYMNFDHYDQSMYTHVC